VERPRSLLLIGESRWGKTEWARSLTKKHAYFCNLFNIDDWSDEAELIIFDDFDIRYVPNWKFWFGCQKRGVIVDKYRKKRTVDNGKRFIWLCNPDSDPRRTLSGAEGLWLIRNTVVYELKEALFTTLSNTE